MIVHLVPRRFLRFVLVAGFLLSVAPGPLPAGGRANVFFPTDDQLESLTGEIKELAELKRFSTLRARIVDLVTSLLMNPKRDPVGICPIYAESPWRILGELWPDLPESIRRDLRTRLSDACARLDALDENAISTAQRIVLNVPDSALRKALAPRLAHRFLEAGRFARAARFFSIAAGTRNGTAKIPFLLGRAAAEKLLTGEKPAVERGAPSLFPLRDPEADRIYRRILADSPDPTAGPLVIAPWSSTGRDALPGSLKARFALPQLISDFKGSRNGFAAQYPVAAGKRAFVFNGEEVVALDLPEGKLRWRRKTPPLRVDLRNTVLAPAVSGLSVYVAAPDKVLRLKAENGEIAWCRYLAVDENGELSFPDSPPPSPPTTAVTPPLYVEGEVLLGIVVSEVQRAAGYLVAFSAERGSVLWQTRAGSCETRDFLGLGTSPLPLAARGGLVYFCPNLGFLAAADVGDGTLEFLRTYPRLEVLAAEYSIRREDRWRLQAPVFWRGRILLSPQDTNEILCFSLWDGALEFRLPRVLGEYFLGPSADRLYLVGRTLKRITLENGFPRSVDYDAELPDRPCGRGRIVGGAVALPFKDRLLIFDASSGAPLSTHLWETPEGGGNCLPTPWGLLVAHRRGVDLYRPVEEDRIEIESAAMPPALRKLKRAHLALKTGDFQKAFPLLDAYLREASRYASSEETVERLQVAQLLGAWLELELPPETELELCDYRSNDRFAVSDHDAVAALSAQGGIYEKMGDLRSALEAYYRGVDRAFRASSRGRSVNLNVKWDLKVSAIPYLTTKIGDLLKRSGSREDLLSAFEKEAQEELRRAETVPHVQVLRSVMRRFPYTRAGQKAFLRCAEVYLANQNSAGATDVLTEYVRDYPRGEFVVESLLLLAEIFEGGERFHEAEAIYRRLLRDFPDRKVSWHGRPVRVDPWVRSRLAVLKDRKSSPASVPVRLPLKLEWRTRTDLLDRTSSLRFLDPGGDATEGKLLVRGDEFVRVYDANDGRLLCVVEAPTLCRHAGVLRSGEREILVLGGRRRISGFFLPSGKPAFKSVSLGEPGDFSIYLDDMEFAKEKIIGLERNRIFCLSTKGEKLWEFKFPAFVRGPVIRSGDTLAVFASSRPHAYLVNLETGTAKEEVRLMEETRRMTIPPIAVGNDRALAVYGKRICLLALRSPAVKWVRSLTRELPLQCRWFEEHPDRVYLWGRPVIGGTRLLALSLSNGKTIWKKYFNKGSPITDLAPYGGDVIALCGEITQTLIRLSPQGDTAAEKWRRRLYQSFDRGPGIRLSGNTVFYGDREINRIVAVSARTGNVQAESIHAVRTFLSGRPLRDYKLENGFFHVLTERGLGTFRFFDRYRSGDTVESLILRALKGDSPDSALDPSLQLGRLLLARGDEAMSLRFLDRVLWEKWPLPGSAPDLWFLLGAAQEETARKDPMIVRCHPAPPGIAIDGYLNEKWPLKTAVRLDSPAAVLPIQGPRNLIPRWEGPEDLSATFFCAWDSDYFYFALDVRDALIVPHNSQAERWLGDCLVIDVDPEGDGGSFPGQDDQMLTLYLSVRQQNPAGDKGKKPEGRFKVRVNDDRAGLVYEVALPWASLGFDGRERKVEPGAAFGFNVVLTDDDTGTGAHQAIGLNASHLLSWKRDRAWESYIPDYFPKIVLEKDEKDR